jgi:hypothetical protein
MRLFRRLASTIPILLAAGLLLAPAAAADPGFSTRPRTVEHAPAGSPKLVDLRAGRHATFDRVVFQIDGPLPWYSVRYVPVVRMDGSGNPVALRGSAFLEVVLRAATDDDGRSVLKTSRLRPDFPVLREVTAPPVSFEGQTVAGVGVSQRVGFRLLELTGPNRIVLDLAHPAGDGPADGPMALAVTPNRGPVGTRVTVEGQGCDPGSATTMLVLTSSTGGTDGIAGLGEFRNDARGRFRATVTIPDRLDPYQGSPGGPTRPGSYAIGTKPPTCMGLFTVTAGPGANGGTGANGPGAARPGADSPTADSPGANGPTADSPIADGPTADSPIADGPPGTQPLTGARSPLLLAVGGGLLVAGTALLALVRRRLALAR